MTAAAAVVEEAEEEVAAADSVASAVPCELERSGAKEGCSFPVTHWERQLEAGAGAWAARERALGEWRDGRRVVADQWRMTAGPEKEEREVGRRDEK